MGPPTFHVLLTTFNVLLTTYYVLLTTFYVLLTTFNFLLTTYYVLLTTFHVLLTTFYVLLTIFYVLLTTFYVLLTTFNFLLTTYYLLTYKGTLGLPSIGKSKGYARAGGERLLNIYMHICVYVCVGLARAKAPVPRCVCKVWWPCACVTVVQGVWPVRVCNGNVTAR